MTHDLSNLKARPTVYKGIEMRSRLEATWAARLDALGLTWEYEPRCYANGVGQYLPDFRVEVEPKAGPDEIERGIVFFEVKGRVTDPFTVMRQMEIVWDSEPDAFLALAEGAPLDSVPDFWPDHPGDSSDWPFWRFAASWYRGVKWTPDGWPHPRREWRVCTDGENPSETARLEFQIQEWDW